MSDAFRASSMLDLGGHNALVTGGGVRLGAEIVRALASCGAAVAIHYSSSSSAALQVASDIRAAGGRASCFQADFADGASAYSALVERAAQELGPLSILVNSAAIFEPATLQEFTESAWDRSLSINLKAPAFLCQAFARALPSDQSGVIINIVDWRGTHPCPGHLPYTIAKAGLAALTRLLAQELGPRKIRVNAVAPGAILPAPGQAEESFQELSSRNPLHRVGGPADIVQAVLYLLAASFVTGEVVHVTGGEQLSRHA